MNRRFFLLSGVAALFARGPDLREEDLSDIIYRVAPMDRPMLGFHRQIFAGYTGISDIKQTGAADFYLSDFGPIKSVFHDWQHEVLTPR